MNMELAKYRKETHAALTEDVALVSAGDANAIYRLPFRVKEALLASQVELRAALGYSIDCEDCGESLFGDHSLCQGAENSDD